MLKNKVRYLDIYGCRPINSATPQLSRRCGNIILDLQRKGYDRKVGEIWVGFTVS